MSHNRLPAAASVLVGALCLSASAVIVKLADVDAATTAVLRCAIAVVPLVPLALAERQRHGTLHRRAVGWSLAAGIALGIDYSAWTASIYLVGAGLRCCAARSPLCRSFRSRCSSTVTGCHGDSWSHCRS